jgi:hypothetical protein
VEIGTLISVKQRWFYLVLAVIAILGAGYIYLHRVELGLVGPSGPHLSDSATTDLTSTSQRPAHIVWQQVDRSPDGFKVEMPTDSKEIQVPAHNERGGDDQVAMISAYPDAETSFSVAWADDPPVKRVVGRPADRVLDTARDDALAITQTTLVDESSSNRLGYPARDFTGKNAGGGVFSSRLILAGSRLYMLIAAFPSASARRDQDVDRFFNSFTLTTNSNRQ